MHDKVQEIIDTFSLLTPDNKRSLFEFAQNVHKAVNTMKKNMDCAMKREEEKLEEEVE